MSRTWRRTNAQIATPDIRWNAHASMPGPPRYWSSIRPRPAVARESDARRDRHRRQPIDDRVGEVARARITPEVVRDVPAVRDHVTDGRLDTFRSGLLAQVPEHEYAAQHESGRVRLVLTRVLRRRAVDRLQTRSVRPDVGSGRDAETTDETGRQVAHDVAIQVREDEDVVLVGLLDQLHAHVVDDPVLELDPTVVLGCDRARGLEEQAVRQLHDVCLVDGRDLAPVVGDRVLERVPRDPL